MRTLRTGSEGRDVRALQNFLTGQHLYEGEVDGRFGPETRAAVIAWQSGHQLTADGIVGAKTWSVLIAAGMDVVFDAEQEWPPPPTHLHPLTTNEQRHRRWGRFRYESAPQPGNREAIRILDDWVEKHIVTVTCPVFHHAVRLHRDVAEDYLAFMEESIRTGLSHLFITDDGAFVPRFIRGSTQTLSNHAWGTAHDKNYAWNQLGQTPAYRGQHGSVRELVPLANKHNWYWGGHFTRKHRRDGMHFEHV